MKPLLVSLACCTALAGCQSPTPAVSMLDSAPTQLVQPTPAAAAGSVGPILIAERQARGLSALRPSAALARAAQAHANDMSRHNYFSHKSRNGARLSDRVRRAGYKFCYAAENIAHGQLNAASVMSAWMNSPGHRRNNLSPKVVEYGVGRTADNYWVLVLASPC